MAEPAIRMEARAKINVFLRVLGSRPDGYHDLESLMVPISLADTVTARRGEGLRVDVRGPDELTDAVAAGGMNLALVAALALGDACDGRGAVVEIDKRIPVAAGLGGGSADAAATLLALNRLWDCGLDTDTMVELASRIGSDVAGLVVGGPVLVTGRGETIERVRVAPTWWVIAPLPFRTRSPDAYRWLDESGAAPGPARSGVVEAAERGDVGELGRALSNDLEPAVAAHHPEIPATKRRLLELGALGAVMTGSGPTVVALARSELHANELASQVDGGIVAFASGEP